MASAAPATAGLVTFAPAPAGASLFTLRAESTPAAWPLTEAGQFGSVRSCTTLPHNCTWVTRHCPTCHSTLLTAVATLPIAAGELLRGPPPPLTARPPDTDDPWQVSFDGGARDRFGDFTTSDGGRAAGGGTALWAPPAPTAGAPA
jgi:hypothetical protein